MKLKTDKIIYHTETQEDFDDLMIKLAEQGISTIPSYAFKRYGRLNCVRVENGNKAVHAELDFYVKCSDFEDYEIVKYKADSNPYIVKLKANQRFLVDWYERNKGDFNNNLIELIDDAEDYGYQSTYSNRYYGSKLFEYIMTDDNSITTLVNMHQFGYEIEEEPRYIVKLPNLTNYKDNPQLICKNENSDKYFACGEYENHIHKFTGKEIKENIEWAWQFAKEVE